MTTSPSPLSEALRHLPHGPEFRFLDEVLELEPGRSAMGLYRVRGEEPFLRGHFPGAPIFPGVLLVEAAAQLAGVAAQSDPARKPLPGLKLTALRAVKILGTARPGEIIMTRVSILGRMGNLVQAEANTDVAGRRVLEAMLTLSGEAHE